MLCRSSCRRRGSRLVPLSEEQKKSLVIATDRYAENLEGVLPYLESRGITEAIAHSRGLGLVRDPILEHKHARDRLSIPYVTPAGPVAMSFRCVIDHNCKEENLRLQAINKKWKHSKYVKPAGQDPELYGVRDAFKDSRDIHIAEGEIDTIVLSELCGLPALGISGAKYWLPWWVEVLRDFRKVFVYCDGDEAGEQLGNKIQKELGLAAILIKLPDGEDVNSIYLMGGADALRGMKK